MQVLSYHYFVPMQLRVLLPETLRRTASKALSAFICMSSTPWATRSKVREKSASPESETPLCFGQNAQFNQVAFFRNQELQHLKNRPFEVLDNLSNWKQVVNQSAAIVMNCPLNN